MRILQWSALLVALALPTMVQAQYTYSTNGGVVTLTGYGGAGGSVVIPDTIDGLPVTCVKTWTFYYHSVTSLTIPASITNIEDSGIYCAGLNAVAVNPASSNFASVDGVLFDKDVRTLRQCPAQRSGNYAIPAGVTHIGGYAFRSCTSLTNIAIPGSVTSIGLAAFEACSSLTGVTIPDSVTSIGLAAFEACSSLTDIAVPDSVTDIGKWAFYACGNLTTIAISSSVTNIGRLAFSACPRLAAITVDESNEFYMSDNGVLFTEDKSTLVQYPVARTGNYAVPGTVSFVADGAFLGASNLTDVTIPNSVTLLGAAAFDSCSSLTSITIPNSVTNMGSNVFGSCTSLINVHLGSGMARIVGFGFAHCTNLSSIVIPGGVTNIEVNAFRNCGSLTRATIPGSVTVIEWDAFAGCPKLAGIYFQGNAPSLGHDPFSGDTNATVYYIAGTTGWGPTFGGRPTALWRPDIAMESSGFGVVSNQFGFQINWAGGMTVVVDVCSNIASPVWLPISTNIIADGSAHFSDTAWTNYPTRFYRLRMP